VWEKIGMTDDGMRRLQNVRLGESLEYLCALSRDQVRPEDALRRLGRLQKGYAECELDLLWEEDPYSKTIHYDLLLHVEGEGSVSLSVCPQGGTPWPLRGLQRRRERDLVRVNCDTVDIMTAMAVIDTMRDKTQVMAHLVYQCLVRGAVRDSALEVADAEVEAVVDEFRRRRGLYGVEQTNEWLAQRGMTLDDLYKMLAPEAAKIKLRDEIAQGRIEEYFASHEREFDTARLARLAVRGEKDARRLYEKLSVDELDFFEAAQRQFLEDAQRGTGELLVVVRREQMPTAYADAIFRAEPGELVGPFQNGDEYDIARVLQISRAKLDQDTRETVKDRLFQEWVERQRQKATIEWFW
jgi:putative peptide maturation system protein